jgi:hypothetical protein
MLRNYVVRCVGLYSEMTGVAQGACVPLVSHARILPSKGQRDSQQKSHRPLVKQGSRCQCMMLMATVKSSTSLGGSYGYDRSESLDLALCSDSIQIGKVVVQLYLHQPPRWYLARTFSPLHAFVSWMLLVPVLCPFHHVCSFLEQTLLSHHVLASLSPLS